MKKPLVYAHIGDLHIETQWKTNYRDLESIVASLATLRKQIDFIVLPGDIANNGKASEFELVNNALKAHALPPIHAITGDHEMVQGNLNNFYGSLRLHGRRPQQLPYAQTIAGVECIFLDMCGPGTGQADFRLDPMPPPTHRTKKTTTVKQIDELKSFVSAADRCIVFMHTYPADLADPQQQADVVGILAHPQVLLVDIGHTHYNEISNDGQKLYAATRSTGQIQEGEVGYSIVTVDEKIVSWRFRLLAAQGPIVLITSPVDRRLATSSWLVSDNGNLRVTVLSAKSVTSCDYSVDGNASLPMTPVPGAGAGIHMYANTVTLPAGARFITVTAKDDSAKNGQETIQLTRPCDLSGVYRHADGSDSDRIGRWSDRGILGSQLGPNRNGVKW